MAKNALRIAFRSGEAIVLAVKKFGGAKKNFGLIRSITHHNLRSIYSVGTVCLNDIYAGGQQ